MTLANSAALPNWEDRLTQSIHDRNLPVTTHDLLNVLADAAEPAAPLTHADHDFLTTHTNLTDADLTPQALATVDFRIASDRATADRDVKNHSLTTQDVSKMLGIAPANVRRLVGSAALYSVKTSPHGHHTFPTWQFPQNRPLPGLADILRALPESYHPLEVQDFMTEPSEELRKMSPVEWLSEGGDPAPVIALADDRAWE